MARLEGGLGGWQRVEQDRGVKGEGRKGLGVHCIGLKGGRVWQGKGVRG